MGIEDYRRRIDQLDRLLAPLLLRRMAVSGEIGRYKREKGLAVYDAAREKSLIAGLTAGLDQRETEALEGVYSAILAASRALQHEGGMNLVIIGMPGAGKTTVGYRVARLLGRPFCDLDTEIELEAGPIEQFITTRGEAAFRDMEQRHMERASALRGAVIATGGGTVLRRCNREAMSRCGRVYLLLRDLALLPTAGRPLSKRGSLADMWEARRPLYEEAADAVIDMGDGCEAAAARIALDYMQQF